jgi:hypothetical protein
MPCALLFFMIILTSFQDALDNHTQMRQVRTWTVRQKRKNALEKQLSRCYREVDILASISHVKLLVAKLPGIED